MDSGVFPLLLLICGILGFILAVGIGLSYLGLLVVEGEVKSCPECHKRGAGDIIKSEVIDTLRYTDSSGKWNQLLNPAKLRRQTQVTEKTHQDHYECRHCGYKWIKITKEKSQHPAKRVKHRARKSQGYVEEIHS